MFDRNETKFVFDEKENFFRKGAKEWRKDSQRVFDLNCLIILVGN